MHKRTRSFIVLLIVVVMAFSMAPGSIGIAAAASTSKTATKTTITKDDQAKLDGLEQEQKELKERIEQSKKNLQTMQNNKAKITQYQAELEDNISLIRKNIKNLESQIAILEADIADKNVEIEEKSVEIEDSKELLRLRLRAMQHSNTQSTLSVIFGADNFSDMMSATKMFDRISQKDRSLIDTLLSEKQTIETLKAGIISDNERTNAAKAELEEDRAELNKQIAESERLLKEIKANEAAIQAQIKADEAEQKKVQAEMAAIYASYKSTLTEFVGGTMAWPVPGYYQITSQFGQREINGKQDNHTGMDISGGGVRGAKIVAALDGVVMATREYSTGYGIHVILDHGGGISTVYAHCQSLAVKEGERVSQGQTIAYVGSTGWSTGPHCHFEVRINGKAVNPYSYVKG